MLRYITLRYVTLHDMTLHDMTLHDMTLQHVTIRYIVLHYIPYTHSITVTMRSILCFAATLVDCQQHRVTLQLSYPHQLKVHIQLQLHAKPGKSGPDLRKKIGELYCKVIDLERQQSGGGNDCNSCFCGLFWWHQPIETALSEAPKAGAPLR